MGISAGCRNSQTRCGHQLGTQIINLAGHVWVGLLCDRDDEFGFGSKRFIAFRRGNFSRFAATGGCNDRFGASFAENGSGFATDLRSDARTEMGDFDGCMCDSGGVFDNYAIVQGVDKIVPVDIYIPGCPPRPEMLVHAIMMLQEKIMKESVKDRYDTFEEESRKSIVPGTLPVTEGTALEEKPKSRSRKTKFRAPTRFRRATKNDVLRKIWAMKFTAFLILKYG